MTSISRAIASLCLSLSVTGAFAVRLAQDPLTQLPLPDSTVTASAPDNTPIKMPSTRVCKSNHQANFYKLSGVKLDALVAWYAGNLKGYSQIASADGRIHVFSNAERSLIVIVTGDPRGDANSAAYEANQPGLSQSTLVAYTTGKIAC
jgi:hypothetical protein